MPGSSDANEQRLYVLAEEFADRQRAGERPRIDDYCARHPDLASDIRSLFPALAELEQAKEGAGPGPAVGLADSPPVTQLGDFRLFREVGRGGMGVVYEAEQLSLGRRVAIKLLPAGALRDPAKHKRFEREAKAAARLHHTNIVPVHGFGVHDGTPYYVMQFIPSLGLDAVIDELIRHPTGGGPPDPSPRPGDQRSVLSSVLARSLREGGAGTLDWDVGADEAPTTTTAGAATPDPARTPRSERGSLPSSGASGVHLPGQPGSGVGNASGKKSTYWESVARIGVQVAGALAYAHRQGVLHRDIKPANLLLDLNGNVWVTDFGLAKADDSDNLTHTGDLLGTLRYMPPEAFEGKSDTRSDIYSLGLTLYELVALRPAYQERDRNKLIRQVTTGDPPRLRKLRADAPRDLVTIVEKAIDRDPARRYPSAGDMADDLQRFLDGHPITARRATVTERLWMWSRRQPALAGLVAAAVGLFVMTAFGATVAALWRAAEKAKDTAETARTGEETARRRAEGLLGDRDKALGGEKAARDAEVRAKGEVAYLNYVHSVDLAHREYAANNIARARELLDDCPAALRGWEWHYVHRLCHADRVTFQGHTGGVAFALFSRNERRVLTASDDGTARVWDAETGNVLVQFTGHTNRLTSAEFSPDGKRVVTASHDKTARVWDAESGKALVTLTGHTGRIRMASFSPDGKRVLTAAEDHTARVWDADSGKTIATVTWKLGTVGSASFSPDGKLVLTRFERVARIWDADSGKPLAVLEGHTDLVGAASFSPDGKRVVTASFDGTGGIWDANTGKRLAILSGHSGHVLKAMFSGDGKRVVTGSEDGTARVWEAESGKTLAVLTGHTGVIISVSFSAEGTRVLTASVDRTARVWDTDSGAEVAVLTGHTDFLWSASFSGDGKRVLTASADGTARIWQADSGTQRTTLKGHSHFIRSVSLSGDGSRAVTGCDDGTARVWDVASGKTLATLTGHTEGLWAVAFSADGRRVVTASADRTARVWDSDSGKQLAVLTGHADFVLSAEFSGDGKRVVTGSWDGTARVWDAESGKELATLSGHTGRVRAASISGDGKRVVTGSEDGTARVWDADSGKEQATLKGDSSAIWSVSISGDGKRAITGSLDNKVRVWDAESGKELAVLRGHADRCMAVSFSADGRRVVTASLDRTVRVWDAESGKQLLSLPGHSGLPTARVPAARFSDDGTRILTAGWAGDGAEGTKAVKVVVHDTRPVNRAFLPPEAAQALSTGSR
jgi:WD40 repeat protein/serine/threonine protein kinase